RDCDSCPSFYAPKPLCGEKRSLAGRSEAPGPENEEARRAVTAALDGLDSPGRENAVVTALVEQPAPRAHQPKQKLKVLFGILFERGIVKDHIERRAVIARRGRPLSFRRETGHGCFFDSSPIPRSESFDISSQNSQDPAIRFDERRPLRPPRKSFQAIRARARAGIQHICPGDRLSQDVERGLARELGRGPDALRNLQPSPAPAPRGDAHHAQRPRAGEGGGGRGPATAGSSKSRGRSPRYTKILSL